MSRCSSCSAPLQPNSLSCRYCGVRSDLDLHGHIDYHTHQHQSDRICPSCDIPLATIDLKIGGQFLIERCNQCYGLFFDLGEVEALLQFSVTNIAGIHQQLIKSINRDRYQRQQTLRYRKCPICRTIMDRHNFGYRSGVVVDRCVKHGIWMDNGEIRHLMEWRKAGGEILQQQQAPSSSTLTRPVSVEQQAEAIMAAQRMESDKKRQRFQHRRETLELDPSISSMLSKLLGGMIS